MEGSILIADDEKTFRDTLASVLAEEGYEVVSVPDGEAALEEVSRQEFDIAFCDIRMPGIDGIRLLTEIRKASSRTSVIIITAYGSIESAVQALKGGAYDYIVKPLIFDEVLVKVRNIIDHQRVRRDYQRLRAEVEGKYDFRDIVGASSRLCEILELVKKVAPTKSTVLVTGESGTGKELIARAIHQNSTRKDENFVPLNCAAIPENLLESELFGHVRGAFTGALSNKEGLFQIADRGTLFLDEVGELPPGLQAKLLRVIEDGEVYALGAVRPAKTDVRFIAATSRNLPQEVERGSFKEELYYRLNIVEIALPPLRERREDIPLLVSHFINKLNAELRKNVSGIDPEAVNMLLACPWKGNVRELQNVIERAMILCEGDKIAPSDFPSLFYEERKMQDSEGGGDSLKEALLGHEREHIIKVLEKTGYDKRKAARLLGLSLSSLYRKIEELSIPPG